MPLDPTLAPLVWTAPTVELPTQLRGMSYFSRVPIRLRTITTVAFVFSTVYLLQNYMRYNMWREERGMGEFNWWREAPVPYLNYFFWALLVPMVYAVIRRFPLTAKPWWKNATGVAAAGVGIGALHEVCTSMLYYTLLWCVSEFEWNAEYLGFALSILPASVLTRFLEYWVLVGILIAVDNHHKAQEKEAQLAKVSTELQRSQLNALREQVHPHFLFNTLNTVSALMDEDMADARRVLARLGRLLRATLNKDQHDKVTLAQELDHVGNYMGIETVRFRDRLRVHYAVPLECQHAEVPNMLLQPLVENAIKHGAREQEHIVDIHVKAERNNGTLVLRVTDNGYGCRNITKAIEGDGIGLKNVRERVRLLYGDHGHMKVGSPNGQGFQVTLSLPFRTSNVEHHEKDQDNSSR
jgi:two-component system, LytTR family, sensor kinase